MKTKLIVLLLAFLSLNLYSQVPQGFNYQAIALDASGNPLKNVTIDVRLSILDDSTGFFPGGLGNYIWEETHTGIKTNLTGMFTVVLGSTTATKSKGSAASFSVIDWSKSPLYIGVKIKYPDTWKIMGAASLWTVPYSMISAKANGLTNGSKLSVVSTDDAASNALFEVKRKDGQTVFAVFPDAVNVYVPTAAKGVKGGFAIGGFGAKAASQDYFRVTPDSVRVYIEDNPTKSSKGGFAVGGFSSTKGGILSNYYMNITGASSVDTVSGSPQILWYPNKNAFLAGKVHIGNVDSVGSYSTALGYKSIAMGDYSQAFGYTAKAYGDYSTSIGKNSIAGSRSAPGPGHSTASNAFAFGNSSSATGDDSYAFGSVAIASGYRSFAFGYNTRATASNSAAFGSGAQATNTNALALGNGSVASGTNSTAMGYQSQAQSDKSIAIGSYYSTSYAIPIISLGGKGSSETTDGTKADVFLPIRPITPITTFTRVFNRANIATGQYSVAIGNGNLAQSGGLVFGSNSTASQFGAIALGTSDTAGMANSVAIGYNSVAKGIYSVALGNNINANSYGELAIGQWNEQVTGASDTWNENDLLFTIGNGVDNLNRSNAITTYKNGKTILRGRYAYSTFNNKTMRLLYNPITHFFTSKDYVYGVYTNLSRDDASIEYYYSGYFTSTGTSGIYNGLYADLINTPQINATTLTSTNVNTTNINGFPADVAEYIYDTRANTEPADVVIVDPDNKISVIKSAKPYQTTVAGVISTKPMMTLGLELIKDEVTGKPFPDARPAARLVLTGRVPVKVTNENGAISPGDMLTTSSTPGCAMKWSLLDINSAKDFADLKRILSENEKRRNAVIGKAVESFTGTGTGKIMVLISLQ